MCGNCDKEGSWQAVRRSYGAIKKNLLLNGIAMEYWRQSTLQQLRYHKITDDGGRKKATLEHPLPPDMCGNSDKEGS